MRYSSHPPRAFRNRIARNLVVLVAAALIATLLLPTAAQAQTPAAPTVEGKGDGTMAGGTITAMWGQPLGMNSKQDQWLVEYTEPGVAWDDATELVIEDKNVRMTEPPLTANDPRIHHGIWKIRVSYYVADLDPDDNIVDNAPAVIGTASAVTDYQHGPPVSAPTGFTAHNAGPDARRLVWDAVTGTSYEYRYTADATDDDAWIDWEEEMASGVVVDDLDMGVEYTFELRALGKTRAGVGDLHGPPASITEMMPTPTPTQVTGVTVDEGDAQLVVNWTAVDNATGYTVQWKSGGQGYNTGDRQATVTPGSTTSHTIEASPTARNTRCG